MTPSFFVLARIDEVTGSSPPDQGWPWDEMAQRPNAAKSAQKLEFKPS